jgi:hypothetical protein
LGQKRINVLLLRGGEVYLELKDEGFWAKNYVYVVIAVSIAIAVLAGIGISYCILFYPLLPPSPSSAISLPPSLLSLSTPLYSLWLLVIPETTIPKKKLQGTKKCAEYVLILLQKKEVYFVGFRT